MHEREKSWLYNLAAIVNHDLWSMVFKPKPDRMVRPGKPRTGHFYSPFKVKNVLCKKSMDPYRPRSNRSVLWIVTSSHYSNGCFVSSLKRRRSISSLFFFPLYGIIWSMCIEQNRNLETEKPSPHSLNHSLSSLPLPHSLNYISHLCLSPSSSSQLSPNRSSAQITAHSLNHSLPLSHSYYISASLPSLLLHCILAQIGRYFILFNSSFFYVNLYFLANFSQVIKQHIIC